MLVSLVADFSSALGLVASTQGVRLPDQVPAAMSQGDNKK